MREVHGSDLQEFSNPTVDGFKSIKPETDMTAKECKAFWDDIFRTPENVSYEDLKDINYYDDNGLEYRRDNELIPNSEFTINEYRYRTDDNGRLISAEGKIKLRDPEYKHNIQDSMKAIGKGDQRETDERGHLIGHQFGGSDRLENLVPMERDLNHGDYLKLENTLADAVKKDSADVYLKVEPVYEGASNRPSMFKVSYSINGEREIVVFRNESGGQHD